MLASTLVTGGAERVVQTLVAGLPSEGFAPRVLCLRGTGEVGREIAASGVPVESGLSHGRFDPLAPARVARRLRDRRDALLFVIDHHDAIFWGGLACRAAGVAHAVLGVHSTGLWKTGRTFSASDRVAVPLYERVVALAPTHARYLAAREGVRERVIAVIPNGVDVERFKPAAAEERRELRRRYGLSEGGLVVTIVAALRPEKNHEMLLGAADELRRTEGDVALLIVGEGSEGERLRGLARERGLETMARFMGRRGDVPEILAASDVSVLCSHPVVETFPLVVLEAMASGLPVVATDVGSIRDMIEDGVEGRIVPSGDVSALVGALRSFARDSALRRAMGDRGRARAVREFSAAGMIRRYGGLFRDLIRE